MAKSLIYLGYRIDEPRQEAVTINAGLYRQVAEQLGWSCEMIAYDGSATTPGRLRRFLRRVAQACRRTPEAVVHDFFVMPGVSLIAQTYLRAKGLPVRYVKTFINPPGTDGAGSVEGLLRLLLNSQTVHNMVAARSESVTYIAPLSHPRYRPLSAPMRYPPSPGQSHEGPVRVSYLGHALRKKGVDLLPRIVQAVHARRPGGAEFRFSFSPLCDVPGLPEQLGRLPGCTVGGEAEPLAFFQHSDVYLLPIRSAFGASGSFNTVWEAMAGGCCVAIARVPGLPELLNDQTAELVSLDDGNGYVDALVGLIDDRQRLSARRACAAQAYARRYTGSQAELQSQLRGLYEPI